MTGHLTKEALSKYAAGNLPSADFLSADDHIAECQICREQLSASQHIEAKSAFLQSDISNAEASEHLRYEDLESFVDGNVDKIDREIIESHLEFCKQCEEQVAELRNLKSSFVVRSGIATKFRILWTSPEYSIVFRTVSLAAMFAFLALITSLITRKPEEKLQARFPVAPTARPRPVNGAPVPQPVAMVASLHDANRTIGVDEKGKVIGADEFPSKYKELARAALTEKKLSVPAWLATVQGQSEVLMGESTDGMPIRLIAPLGTVTDSRRPVFEWKALPAANRYRVSVYDQNFQMVASSEFLSATSWTPSSDLPRGLIYTWKITAVKNGQQITSPIPPAPEAKFKIVSEEQSQAINEARKMNSHLLLALAYTDAGMLMEAKSELEALSKANPDSPLPSALLKNLQ